MEGIGKTINDYIIKNWLCDYKYDDGTFMFTQFAKEHYIEEKIARKIVKDSHYQMTIETLEKMCTSRDISLEKFFKQLNR